MNSFSRHVPAGTSGPPKLKPKSWRRSFAFWMPREMTEMQLALNVSFCAWSDLAAVVSCWCRRLTNSG